MNKASVQRLHRVLAYCCSCVLLPDTFKMLLMVEPEILSIFSLVNILLQPGGINTKTYRLLEICELGYF